MRNEHTNAVDALMLECMAFTLENGIAEIRFSRPDLLNRFDTKAHGEFDRLLKHIAGHSENIRVLVISAEGRAFSAGGDFGEMLVAHEYEQVRERMRQEAGDIFNAIVCFPFPVIAAVQGAAIGLGATIATLSDILVAWRGAKIADTHVKVGLVAGDGGVVGWTQSVGLNRAKYYLLTGEMITGEQAHAIGLATKLVDNPSDARDVALMIARQIASLLPEAVQGTKAAFAPLSQAVAQASFQRGLDLEIETMKLKAHFDIVKAMMARKGP